MSEQLMAAGEQSLTALSEAMYWCKKLLNYSLGHINKFPELLRGNYPSYFTSTSIYSAISSSADSGFGKLSTLLFQLDVSLWGSNCPCSVAAFWEEALHQNSGRFSSPQAPPVPSLTPSICTWMTFQLPPALGQSHSCSGTVAAPLQRSFTSPPGLTLSLKLQRKLKSCTKVHFLEKLNTWQQKQHLKRQLTFPIRIQNYRKLTITIRRCSKSFLQYQMDLAINSQAQVTIIFQR